MKNNVLLSLVLFASTCFSSIALAVDYSASAVEKKGEIFYLKETQQPLTGTLIRTFPSGAKRAASTFENGVLNGESIGFFENGVTEHTIVFKNNIKDGAFKKYDENGRLIAEATYKNNKLNGQFTAYYPNGKLYLTEIYQDDLLNGPRINYYDSGKIKSESLYKNNLLNGEAKEYYADGTIRSVSHFVNNEREGVSKTFYPNGNPQFEMHFIKNRLNGESVNFNEDGTLSQKRIYNDGQVISGILVQDGKEVPLTAKQIIELNSKTMIHTPQNTYRQDGLVYDKETKQPISGTYRVFSANNVVSEEYEFWNGKPHGLSQTFDKNGILLRRTVFEDGKKQISQTFDSAGKVIQTCKLINDKEVCE